MRQKRKSHSSLLLLELTIVILFFALGSAICIQVFAQAHLTGQNARDLTFASREASSAAALLRGTDGSISGLREYYPEAEITDTEAKVCFDKNRQHCAPENAAYSMAIQVSSFGFRADASITVSDADGDSICQMDLLLPAPPETAGEEVLP